MTSTADGDADNTGVAGRTRSWWGWGWQEEAVGSAERAALVARLPRHWVADPLPVPAVADLGLPAPRVTPPATVAKFCSAEPVARAGHTFGKAYRDVVRALRGEFTHPPDLVAFPRAESDVVALFDWAGAANVALIAYGGGSSVVGGVEYRGGDHAGVVSVDLSRLHRLLEVDAVSRAACVQAGVLGPDLERQLAEHGMTLRFFPQSFEFSSLGGWLATRAGGHFATGRTHIDDMVESLRVVAPAGVSESRRLPASGAGPSPDRFFLGSEGALGVITQAWLRVLPRPVFRASTSVAFGGLADGLAALRAIVQAGLEPANCRLLDAAEAAVNLGRTDGAVVLVVGFESAHQPVDAALATTVAVAADHGGRAESTEDSSRSAGAVGNWRAAFLRMPYVRDALVRSGVLVETFETAVTWQGAATLFEEIRSSVGAAVAEVCGEPGLITSRVTHVYPDGVAPYFTVIAPARRGSEVAMWDDVKAAASETLDRCGATITHHHAVGRDHYRWYDRQRPALHAQLLRGAKKLLDPSGILNPGVLVD